MTEQNNRLPSTLFSEALRENAGYGVITHGRRDTASTVTDLDIDLPNGLYDPAIDYDTTGYFTQWEGVTSLPSTDDLFAEEHPLACKWQPHGDHAATESLSLMLGTVGQKFPQPGNVEMVPVNSVNWNRRNVNSQSPKKTSTKESPLKPRAGMSPGKKRQKRGSKSSLVDSQDTDMQTCPLDLNRVPGCPDAVGDHPVRMHSTPPAVSLNGILSYELSGVAYPPISASTFHIADHSRSLLQCPSIKKEQGQLDSKRRMGDSQGLYMRKPTKRATRRGTAENETEFASTRLCQRNKRGRKAKEMQLLAEGELSPRPKIRSLASPEIAQSRSMHSRRDHPNRGGRNETSGRTTFADMVDAHFIRTGPLRLAVGHESDVMVTIKPEGSILYKGDEYGSISSFALAVIRERNPGRRSCDGWKDVKYEGQKLETLRERFLCG